MISKKSFFAESKKREEFSAESTGTEYFGWSKYWYERSQIPVACE